MHLMQWYDNTIHPIFVGQLSRQGSSVESGSTMPIHHHTAECSGAGRSLHQPTHHSKVNKVFLDAQIIKHSCHPPWANFLQIEVVEHNWA
jgi:hypothetical protein